MGFDDRRTLELGECNNYFKIMYTVRFVWLPCCMLPFDNQTVAETLCGRKNKIKTATQHFAFFKVNFFAASASAKKKLTLKNKKVNFQKTELELLKLH